MMKDGKTGQEEEETRRARWRNCPLGTFQFCPYDGSIFPLCCGYHLSFSHSVSHFLSASLQCFFFVFLAFLLHFPPLSPFSAPYRHLKLHSAVSHHYQHLFLFPEYACECTGILSLEVQCTHLHYHFCILTPASSHLKVCIYNIFVQK